MGDASPIFAPRRGPIAAAIQVGEQGAELLERCERSPQEVLEALLFTNDKLGVRKGMPDTAAQEGNLGLLLEDELEDAVAVRTAEPGQRFGGGEGQAGQSTHQAMHRNF